MPFGLSNAATTFQEYINKILAKKLVIFVIVYLDDILIYIKDSDQPYIEAVQWVLNQLRKYCFFSNLKKCWFHQNEVCFQMYVVFFKGISIKVEQIKVVKKWPESKSIRDIQVFLGFANFYQQLIQGFSMITALLTSMLKIIGSSKKLASSRNNGSKPVYSRNNSSRPAFRINDDNGKVHEFSGDDVK